MMVPAHEACLQWLICETMFTYMPTYIDVGLCIHSAPGYDMNFNDNPYNLTHAHFYDMCS